MRKDLTVYSCDQCGEELSVNGEPKNSSIHLHVKNLDLRIAWRDKAGKWDEAQIGFDNSNELQFCDSEHFLLFLGKLMLQYNLNEKSLKDELKEQVES